MHVTYNMQLEVSTRKLHSEFVGLALKTIELGWHRLTLFSCENENSQNSITQIIFSKKKSTKWRFYLFINLVSLLD